MEPGEAIRADLRAAELGSALERAKGWVRKSPDLLPPRILLFQLFCLAGRWQQALTQLDVLAGLRGEAMEPMVHTYRELLAAEQRRERVVAGLETPRFLGEPPDWAPPLAQACATADAAQAAVLRKAAAGRAPPVPGSVNGRSFAWIADADPRFGPLLEVVVAGRYYWLPFANLTRLEMEPPADLRDFAWMPASLSFTNGGQSVGFIPTRYPGSADPGQGCLALGRLTEWQADGTGLGQRMLATDEADIALMDIRTLELRPAAGSCG